MTLQLYSERDPLKSWHEHQDGGTFSSVLPRHTVLDPRSSLLKHEHADEETDVLVVLKTAQSEEELRHLLPNLELVLSAHATDAVPQGAGNAASASGKHDLASKSFSGSSFVTVVSVGDNAYAIWKPILPLSRPRARLQRPAIYFTATLRIDPSVLHNPKENQKEYLKSYEPLPENILEPFQHDPVLRHANVYLSETRITKVAPKPPSVADVVKPIRGASKRAYPAVPALFTMIRFSALPDATIASLHVETSRLIAGTIRLTKVNIGVRDSVVEEITTLPLPMETRGGDETIFLYKLLRKGTLPGNVHKTESTAPAVEVLIEADVALDQGSNISLNVCWKTDADISTYALKPSYTWSRPLKTSSHHKSLSMQSVVRPSSRDAGVGEGEAKGGVIFTFVCPAAAQQNEEFQMSIKCLNRSDRQRRFALVILQPRKPLVAPLAGVTHAESDLVAKVINAPPLARIRAPDVLDLNPDVRIGPLPSGACFETHMSFRALTTGVLDLGTLRIVDLDSRQRVDVQDLPDVVALEAGLRET